jgi:hypothetical protein
MGYSFYRQGNDYSRKINILFEWKALTLKVIIAYVKHFRQGELQKVIFVDESLPPTEMSVMQKNAFLQQICHQVSV